LIYDFAESSVFLLSGLRLNVKNINSTIFKEDTKVTAVTQNITIGANTNQTIRQAAKVETPILWSVEKP
jgi:hypothetical protein